MKHEVKVLHIQEVLNLHRCRTFMVEVDGIEMKGKIQLIRTQLPTCYLYSYRFYFGKHNTITKHSDYKDIRRQLLLLMIKKNHSFMDVAGVIR